MPQHRQILGITRALRLVLIRQPYEVENEPIDNLIGKRVLLIQQDTNEQRIWTWANAIGFSSSTDTIDRT